MLSAYTDCISSNMRCDKLDSNLIFEDGCACTLPPQFNIREGEKFGFSQKTQETENILSKHFNLILILVLVAVAGYSLYCPCNGSCRFFPSTKQPQLEKFIPSLKFVGAKRGYVFKSKDGNLGYYKDSEVTG